MAIVERAVVLGRPGVIGPGVKPPAFASALWTRLAGVAARVGVGVAGVAISAWGVRHGVPGVLVAASVLTGAVWWVVGRPDWGSAWRVVVADQYVEATGYGGMRVRLAWDGVGEIQHFVRRTIRGPVRVLRLLSIDRQRRVSFNERMPGFEQLMRLVESKVRHVSAGAPSAWDRLLWSKAGRG